MRTTLDLDRQLVEQALAETGAILPRATRWPAGARAIAKAALAAGPLDRRIYMPPGADVVAFRLK